MTHNLKKVILISNANVETLLKNEATLNQNIALSLDVNFQQEKCMEKDRKQIIYTDDGKQF